MYARIIVLGLTISLTLSMAIQSVGLATESKKSTNKSYIEQGFHYDHQMVEGVPGKTKSTKQVFPIVLLSWRPV
jgi:hypothetical protein